MAIRVFVRKRQDRKSLVLFYDDPQTGKEVSRSAGTSDRGEAARAAARWEDELKEFRGSNEDGWDLFRERFMTELAANKAKATRLAYRTAFKRYRELMQPTTIAEVTASTLSQFTAKLKCKPTTKAKHLRHLKTALRWAATVGIIAKAPHVEIPSQGKRKFMRGRALTKAEYRKMLKHAGTAGEAKGWQRLLKLLWLSGLRLEEALTLSWDTPPLYVELGAQPYPQLVIYGEAQKSRNDETVPIAPDFAAWLGRAPERSRRGRVISLRGRTNKRVRSKTEISKALTAIGRAAGIVVRTDGKKSKHASAHDLRRAFGTRWALKVAPLVLQRMMRHATLQTTMRYYVNLEAAQIGEALWKGVPPESPPGKLRIRKPPRELKRKTS